MSTEGDIVDSYGNSMRRLQQSFQDGVDTLYNACVSAGQTPTDKSPSSIANAIKNITNNVSVSSLGGGTSINVKNALPNDYSRLNNNSFIIEYRSLSANGGASLHGAQYPQQGSISAKATMSKSYNASSGILTISGVSCSNSYQNGDRTWTRYINASVSINVYAVL